MPTAELITALAFQGGPPEVPEWACETEGILVAEEGQSSAPSSTTDPTVYLW